ncbi:hypothetical protein EKO27_g11733 [Xylaria grammica]|uniref:Uncharacterized protein n=1 Tax=Xylaria grammica TaxID=363999 RepID=A0A439CMJ0_9PEZI|nr:hypothetical protein EKO27_g11733 [Xylaria grammica]
MPMLSKGGRGGRDRDTGPTTNPGGEGGELVISGSGNLAQLNRLLGNRSDISFTVRLGTPLTSTPASSSTSSTSASSSGKRRATDEGPEGSKKKKTEHEVPPPPARTACGNCEDKGHRAAFCCDGTDHLYEACPYRVKGAEDYWYPVFNRQRKPPVKSQMVLGKVIRAELQRQGSSICATDKIELPYSPKYAYQQVGNPGKETPSRIPEPGRFSILVANAISGHAVARQAWSPQEDEANLDADGDVSMSMGPFPFRTKADATTGANDKATTKPGPRSASRRSRRAPTPWGGARRTSRRTETAPHDATTEPARRTTPIPTDLQHVPQRPVQGDSTRAIVTTQAAVFGERQIVERLSHQARAGRRNAASRVNFGRSRLVEAPKCCSTRHKEISLHRPCLVLRQTSAASECRVLSDSHIRSDSTYATIKHPELKSERWPREAIFGPNIRPGASHRNPSPRWKKKRKNSEFPSADEADEDATEWHSLLRPLGTVFVASVADTRGSDVSMARSRRMIFMRLGNKDDSPEKVAGFLEGHHLEGERVCLSALCSRDQFFSPSDERCIDCERDGAQRYCKFKRECVEDGGPPKVAFCDVSLRWSAGDGARRSGPYATIYAQLVRSFCRAYTLVATRDQNTRPLATRRKDLLEDPSVARNP